MKKIIVPKNTKVCAIMLKTPNGQYRNHWLPMYDIEEFTELLTTNDLE